MRRFYQVLNILREICFEYPKRGSHFHEASPRELSAQDYGENSGHIAPLMSGCTQPEVMCMIMILIAVVMCMIMILMAVVMCMIMILMAIITVVMIVPTMLVTMLVTMPMPMPVTMVMTQHECHANINQ
uniref:Uncharacterized protein n=1 Tax=Salix viminalis TaxID=40686 RepID=A0A6N2KTT4_SALVM